MSTLRQRALPALVLAAFAAALSGCGRDMGELEAYIAEVNQRPGGRIEPLPRPTIYDSFAYQAYDLRSPFVPDAPEPGPETAAGGGLRPDAARPREFLEQFPLDTLDMVGTLTHEGQFYALVQTQDLLVHRVQVGNYIGQNDGRIVDIDEAEIQIVEIIPDGIGGYMERRATIGLGET